MRGKDNVLPTVVLPVFLKLFRCKDKELRKFLHGVIISDLKQLNHNQKNVNVNKKLQNFILSLMQDPNEDAARRAMNVMVELYKRRIWNDEKTVNAIWTGGVLHSNPKIISAACKFFLVLDYDWESEASMDSEDEADAADLLAHHKGSKLTSRKKAYLQRAIKA
jgi:protein SDA1